MSKLLSLSNSNSKNTSYNANGSKESKNSRDISKKNNFSNGSFNKSKGGEISSGNGSIESNNVNITNNNSNSNNTNSNSNSNSTSIKMKALQITEPSVMKVVDIEKPQCGSDEVLLRIHYVGFCGWNKWWLSSEGVWLYGSWHNVFNGVAGLLNIFCMTAWWNVYASKDKKDMIWADMTWVYILIYDIWNFAYTYNCLPTHSW